MGERKFVSEFISKTTRTGWISVSEAIFIFVRISSMQTALFLSTGSKWTWGDSRKLFVRIQRTIMWSHSGLWSVFETFFRQRKYLKKYKEKQLLALDSAINFVTLHLQLAQRSCRLQETPKVASATHEFANFYGTRRFIRARHWSLPWPRWIQSITSHPSSL